MARKNRPPKPKNRPLEESDVDLGDIDYDGVPSMGVRIMRKRIDDPEDDPIDCRRNSTTDYEDYCEK